MRICFFDPPGGLSKGLSICLSLVLMWNDKVQLPVLEGQLIQVIGMISDLQYRVRLLTTSFDQGSYELASVFLVNPKDKDSTTTLKLRKGILCQPMSIWEYPVR